jgi:RNA polymerase sigma-70 factor (ECF subfamily)
MIEASDAELVARVAAADDTAAFELLVLRHQSKVRNWLRQLTKDASRADDLAQDTFLRAWQSIQSFSGKGTFASWVMKIAYNNHLQAVRKRARDARLETALATSRGAPEVAPNAEEWPDLAKLLAVLSDEERLTMVLCYAHDLSHSEIADVIEMPLGTVKSHINRAKAKIRGRFNLAERA